MVVVDDLSAGDPARVNLDADLVRQSVVDQDALVQLFDSVRPSVVFHLAAQASVTVSTRDPAQDCAINVVGTLNVLETAKRSAAPTVFTSTGGALYGDEAPIPTSEEQLPAPRSP